MPAWSTRTKQTCETKLGGEISFPNLHVYYMIKALKRKKTKAREKTKKKWSKREINDSKQPRITMKQR